MINLQFKSCNDIILKYDNKIGDSMNLSKSKYVQGATCKKKLWLSFYKPEEAKDMNNKSVFENGNKVGELARDLFGDSILIDYNLGFEKMISETKKKLTEKGNIICEASFNYDGNFCSVDILKNDKDGVEIYEVKSSTSLDNIYIDDISYQTWVLKKCGLNVKKSSIIYINSKYIKNGDFNIHEFFHIEDVSSKINLKEVEKNIEEYKKVINSNEEPNIDLSLSCHDPYDCPYFEYCTKNLLKPNVFDIGWNTNFNKKIEMYKSNHISFKDILKYESLNEKAKEQVRYTLNDLSPKINIDNIKEFLNKLRYPLYFLDFESYQSVIPTIDGTKPYQQICFQYSLHYYLEEGKELFHKEYLSKDYDGNPMIGLCKKLCEDIPLNSCVLVYNQTFEKTRLKEMAELFPEYHDHLLNIKDNIIDLMIPFFKQDYYTKEMEGSYSIKKVLPALFPNDETLDYHNLDQVHKGDEASNAYLALKDLNKEEEEKLRNNLLKYCKLDTYAMVKIYDKLKELK